MLFISGYFDLYKEAAAGGVLQKRCSLKFHKINRKTPKPECLFKKSCTLNKGNFFYRTHRATSLCNYLKEC